MEPVRQKRNLRVAGLLGVGFDHEDRQIRITRADTYQVLMGSGETHEVLQQICSRIEKKMEDAQVRMGELSPEEFMELIRDLN